MRKEKGSFIDRLCKASKSELDEEIKEEFELCKQVRGLHNNRMYEAFLLINASKINARK